MNITGGKDNKKEDVSCETPSYNVVESKFIL